MHKTHAKRRRDIKNKLMAAICMLLVSSIMMVSTTYAWFTLSTAPEVTGINTAVGANGNLEMALLPKDGLTGSITSAAGDSVLGKEAKNVTWGNLVDLSMEGNNSIYGLDKITLYPAELNITEAGKLNTTTFLKTPTYGADGRVSELLANSVTGYYSTATDNFSPNDYYGVRAVGTASGMTDRQLDYRNARQAANTASALAANKASQSLNNNGSALANIAIKYGMNSESATFNGDDVEALRAIVDDLTENGGVLDQLEKAYMQYILAYAASKASGDADTIWQAVSGAVNKEDATLESVVTAIGESNIPDAVKTGIKEYNDTVDAVEEADTKLKAMETTLASNPDATFAWATLRDAMAPLADPTAMEINGFKASEVKANLGELVSSVTKQGGLKVIMKTDGGVYADIADQSGDYTASITIERVEYQGIVLENMDARMETDSSLTPDNYLVAIGTVVNGAGAPSSGTNTVLPISDMYGYIIDLAFRTNASGSKLLLQQKAVDRIYDNNTNEETMGHGASMTFMATTTDFSNDQVKGLMDSIKIVFFNPADGTIYCYGGLDTANATIGTAGITAEIYLYSMVKGETTYTEATYDATSGLTYYTKSNPDTYTPITNEQAEAVTDGNLYIEDENQEGQYVATTYDANSGKTYYTKTNPDVYTKSDDPANAGVQLYTATVGTDSKETITSNEIMALTQNTAHALSVLVYLDGETVTNADVAATGNSSMTGTMNLQFSSSANLVPMEYADLHIPGAADATTGSSTETTGASTETTAASGG